MQSRSQRERQRHPTSNLRYTFEAEGASHRAVCSNVAVGGAFFRARFIPAPGQEITLRATPEESGIHLVCRVVWALSTARLNAPETGFGVAFEEAYSIRSESNFLAFLRAEFGLADVKTNQVARDGRAAYAYDFEPHLDDTADTQKQVAPTSLKGPFKTRQTQEHSDPRGIIVTWAKGEAIGHLTHIADSMARVTMHGSPPSLYEGVTLTPSYPSFQMPALIMHGTVTGSGTLLGEAGQNQIAVRIWEIEELDDDKTFERYQRIVEEG
jgi:hypothetical protein